MAGEDFVQLESGVFVPPPKDQKFAVHLMAAGEGWSTTVNVDIPSVEEAYDWLEECLDSDHKWFRERHPVWGTPTMISRRLLESVISIGIAWHDLDAVKADLEQQRLLKLQTQRGRRGNGR